MPQESKDHMWKLIAKKLADEASPAELEELERLLRDNPALHYSMQTVTDLWTHAVPTDREKAEQAFDRHLDRMKELNIDVSNTLIKRKTIRIGATSWLVAGVIVAGITFAYLRFPGMRDTMAGSAVTDPGATNMISTHNGSRTNVVLPDGSQVWLNAGSKITYNKSYGNTLREVNLTGEAFFDVIHNAEKPFIIHTARIDIKVLGTSFNVKSYPTDKTTEATLIQGSIEVLIRNRFNEKIILKPNEKILVSEETETLQTTRYTGDTVKTNEPIFAVKNLTHDPQSGAVMETSWVENKLIFQDESFRDLAQQLERWYGVTIRFASPRAEQFRFTGLFENETIQQALDALRLTASFHYSIHNNEITISE